MQGNGGTRWRAGADGGDEDDGDMEAQGIGGVRSVCGNCGCDGAQGQTAPAGPQGAAGNAGTSGSSGTTGAKGDQGDNGADGADGNDGADSTVAGPQGPQGIVGETGEAGAQGIPGHDGAIGDDGADGAQGQQGLRGLQGEAGINGHDGAAGAQGIQGNAGADGVDGVDGVGGVKDFVASGTLSNGTTVILKSNGTVEAVTYDNGAASIPQATPTVLGNAYYGYQVAFDDSTSGSFILASAGTYSQTVLTAGTLSGFGFAANILHYLKLAYYIHWVKIDNVDNAEKDFLTNDSHCWNWNLRERILINNLSTGLQDNALTRLGISKEEKSLE